MDDPILTRAILIWKAGLPIDMDHAVALLALGYDVETLEDKYRNPSPYHEGSYFD